MQYPTSSVTGQKLCGSTSFPLKLEGVHRTLTPRSTAVIYVCTALCKCSIYGANAHNVGAWIWIRDGNISAKQQSYTDKYGVVHENSNHTRKNTKEYGVLHEERD